MPSSIDAAGRSDSACTEGHITAAAEPGTRGDRHGDGIRGEPHAQRAVTYGQSAQADRGLRLDPGLLGRDTATSNSPYDRGDHPGPPQQDALAAPLLLALRGDEIVFLELPLRGQIDIVNGETKLARTSDSEILGANCRDTCLIV